MAQGAAAFKANISIHAPREGSDPGNFLILKGEPHDFYPRSPRGERHGHLPTGGPNHKFLSTLPARGATANDWPFDIEKLFLSTLPARGATAIGAGEHRVEVISIHAPREGSDRTGVRCRGRPAISIHAPREGSDLSGYVWDEKAALFLSTLPARGATPFFLRSVCRQ